MSTFATTLANRMESYIALQRSLGYQFGNQAASLRAFLRYVQSSDASGPLSQALAVDFVMAGDLTPNGRAVCYGVIRRSTTRRSIFAPSRSIALPCLARAPFLRLVS